MRRRARGLSVLELAIVVALIGILITVAIQRMLSARILAEAAAVERVLVVLRTVVVLEQAHRLIRGLPVQDMEGADPMSFWDRHVDYPLPRYVGSADGEVEGGSWYYDRAGGVLVFRTAFPDHFRSSGPDPERIRIRIVLGFEDRNGNGRRDPGEPAQGARLEVMDRYGWRGEEVSELQER